MQDPLQSNAAGARHQQLRRRHSSSSALPSLSSASDSADRRPHTAGSAASSGWESQVEILAESLQGKMTVTSTQLEDLSPIIPGYQNTPPVEGYPFMFADPLSEHNDANSRHTPSSIVGGHPPHFETPYTSLQSRASSSRSVAQQASEDEHNTAHPDPSVSKTYSFVSLPGNAVRKRPRRRFDELEHIYHCSWSGCTKSYGTLNHLNAHIVMQRHGNKRTPAEFKELRKEWRKAKKDELERLEKSVSDGGRHRLYGPEMDHRPADGETTARNPLSAGASSMRPQPLQQQPYGYPMSGPGHSLYSIVSHTPTPSLWPEQATQYEGTTPPQHGSTPGHALRPPAQAAYDYERKRQGHSWTPPSILHPPPSPRPVPPYELALSYPQPQPSPQRVDTLPPDSTLLTPLPGYKPSTVEPEYEEEYDNKQQFWTEQQH